MGPWGSFASKGQGPRVRESTMKPVGKPDARNGHVGLMSGDGNRGGASASVPAPILDSTPLRYVGQDGILRPIGNRPWRSFLAGAAASASSPDEGSVVGQAASRRKHPPAARQQRFPIGMMPTVVTLPAMPSRFRKPSNAIR